MKDAATILVVDDTPANVKLLVDLLASRGYQAVAAASGEQALALIAESPPDLVLLDIMMPGLSGYDVCRRIRAEPGTALLPVVLCTSLDPKQERINGIEAGADDFLPKPIQQQELFARVKSLLRIKSLQDQVALQAAQLAEWNLLLEQRVRDQLAQMERLSRLKHFFSPALAEAIVGGGVEDPLKSRRRELTVVFLDLRGFTAFTETADPEEVMQVLGEYHKAMGELILASEGTLERFTGDGIVIFFNDPMPVPDAPQRAVRMAVQMQRRMADLSLGWQRKGYQLHMGIGIAMGYATIGGIGFEGRLDYGAIGTVMNLAARLCGEAAGGEILLAPRVVAALGGSEPVEPAGEIALKGFARPVAASRARWS